MFSLYSYRRWTSLSFGRERAADDVVGKFYAVGEERAPEFCYFARGTKSLDGVDWSWI